MAIGFVQTKKKLILLLHTHVMISGTKIRLYKTILRPTIQYACDAWILNKDRRTPVEMREENFKEEYPKRKEN